MTWRTNGLCVQVTDPRNYEMERDAKPFLIEEYRGGMPDDDWAVPDWTERGLSVLAGPFATREEAEAAIASLG